MSAAQAARISDELYALVIGVWMLVGMIGMATWFGWRTKR